MELGDASAAISVVDARENESRAQRLVELERLLADDVVGFSGPAAEWLFEDVKATWIYGYLTAAVLAAYAFCVQQLAGLVRMLPDDPDLPADAQSLEGLAAAAEDRELIDLEFRARLVRLHDIAAPYMRAGLHEYDAQIERRIAEAELFGDDDALVADARTALSCAVSLLHRRT